MVSEVVCSLNGDSVAGLNCCIVSFCGLGVLNELLLSVIINDVPVGASERERQRQRGDVIYVHLNSCCFTVTVT